MRTCLLLSALLPLLFLTGCGDGEPNGDDQPKVGDDEPKVGDRILFGIWVGEEVWTGHSKGHFMPCWWLLEKTPNTVVFRHLEPTMVRPSYKVRDVDRPLSEIAWIKKHAEQVPMPPSENWESPAFEGIGEAAVQKAIEALKNQRL